MTDYKLTQEFIAAAMSRKTGQGREEALEAARAFIEVSLVMNLITRDRLSSNEDSARMYELRAKGVTPTVLAMRFPYCRQEIYKRIKRQILFRRTV